MQVVIIRKKTPFVIYKYCWSDFIPEMKQHLMLSDMDEWGYSFRLGSAKNWFEKDAEDALAWLQRKNIINHKQEITFLLQQ